MEKEYKRRKQGGGAKKRDIMTSALRGAMDDL
jgi:hypothetical protein